MAVKGVPELAAWPPRNVDVAVVIALDVSASVTSAEYLLMQSGLARAISSPAVLESIESGLFGAIALSVMHWSGFQEQRVMSDWTYVSNAEESTVFADKVARTPRQFINGATDIGGAIVFCQKMIFGGPVDATRLIIDLAGDGSNNVNFSPRTDSDAAAQAGITINCLAVPNKDAGLVEYYRQTVIAGPGAFVEHTPDYRLFAEAMERKLIAEITTLYS